MTLPDRIIDKVSTPPREGCERGAPVTAGPRPCANCAHDHDGGKYGLCFERLLDGSLCPCIRASAMIVIPMGRVRPRRRVAQKPPRTAYCERQRVRHAKDTYDSLTLEERAVLDRVASRLDDTLLTLEEYAAETGWDRQLIWRARRDLGLKPQPMAVGSLHRPQPRSVG